MKCSVFKVAFSVLIISAVSYLYSDTVHEVQKGETLYSISKNYGISVDSIKEANGFADNSIKIGQKIKIPQDSSAVSKTQESPSTQQNSAQAAQENQKEKNAQTSKNISSDGSYIVQKGETWFGISKKYGISVADLQKLNGVGNEAALKIGQKIKVPSESNVGSQTTSVATTKNLQPESKDTKTTKDKESKKTSSAVANVPDLKTKDPHSYSGKKADSSLVWPVKADSIVYINGKVGGVSMAAKKDEEVKAIRAGTVMFSGSYRGFGNVVFIQSKTGHIYAYTGLGSIDVSKGDYINYSSEIGTAGIDSYTGKSQISLMVFQNGQPIDPAKAPRG